MALNQNHDKLGFVKQHATTILVVAGLTLMGVGMYSIHASLQDFAGIDLSLTAGFGMMQNVVRSQMLAQIGVLGGALFILGGVSHAVSSEAESRMADRLKKFESRIETELQKRVSVHETSSADQIWLNSTRMLEDLSQRGYKERHAYDVTTYFNRVRYEEMVAQCVAQGIVFRRVFCFRVQGKRPSDELMEWYLRSIVNGAELSIDDLNNQTFRDDLLLAFKEHERDSCPSELSSAHVERLNAIIRAQKAAVDDGNLRFTPLDRRMPMDFIVTDYVRDEGGSQEYEVQANFKTALQKETYVAGTYGKGAYARHYQQLFVDIIEQGIV